MLYFIAFLLIVIIIIFFILRRKKCDAFVIEHSQALRELKRLNDKYSFFDVSDYVEKNTYDNEKIFDNVSCEDYLIYQLQFTQSKVGKEIDKANYNKNGFNSYCKDLSKINSFGEFDAPTKTYNKKRLRSIETKIFNHETKKSPTTNFVAKVILYCSTMSGRVYYSKRDTFNIEEIKTYIRRLNNRNGKFYNDRGIWDSICRVERGKVSNKMRFAIYERDGYRCRICGRTDRDGDLEIDHIKPISKGGKSTYDNLQTLCKQCNKEKGDRYY